MTNQQWKKTKAEIDKAERTKNFLNSVDLFNAPISSKKVRKNVTAYQYRNGCVNINGQKFFGYSMTDAIRKWRNNN